MIDGKEFLITGGSGTLGKELVYQIKKDYNPRGIRIYSRDEYKHLLAKEWFLSRGINLEKIEFIIGDIADYTQLKRVMSGVDIVIHTAALKQVLACEDNPIEAIRVNIIGAENVVMAAWENQIEQVINIATDKGVYPVNLYGMGKAIAEKLMVFGAVYTGGRKPFFKSCRYGNVIGSRGSVVPVWKRQVKDTGKITITNREMTRFFIPLEKVAKFILERLQENETGKIYVPKMKSIQMGEFADMLFPGVPQQEIGIRPGEKIHEIIITGEENIFTQKVNKHYVIDAYRMKIDRFPSKDWESGLTSYGLDSYNNPERWGEEILKYCKGE
jgi:FlaA1/EpsC-like NDP-sugar epimerase